MIGDTWDVGRSAFEVSALLSEQAAWGLLEAVDGEVSEAAFRHAVRTHVPESAQPLVVSLLEGCGGSRDAWAAAVAAAVVTRTHVEAELGTTEIVWTGPSTVPVSAHRPTAAVAHELIASAKHHLTLATFSASKVGDLIDVLDRRRREGLDIRLLLETPRSNGEGPDCPAVFGRVVPYVTALEWPRISRQDHDWTSMHVKVLIRDDDAVLISSANFSRAAMRDNMELGVCIEGGSIPARLRAHFDDLEDSGVITPLPT